MGKPPHFSARDERRLEEWQFLLLRFAITRDSIDRAAAESAARTLDATALEHAASFSYFQRTTRDVCSVMTDPGAQRSKLMLQTFVSRIDDKRLKAAFSACLELTDIPVRSARPRADWRDRQDLWRGLPKR
jgi:hypothetical protein